MLPPGEIDALRASVTGNQPAARGVDYGQEVLKQVELRWLQPFDQLPYRRARSGREGRGWERDRITRSSD